MITVVAKCVVQQEFVERFEALAAQLIQATQQEEGCRDYHIYRDVRTPQTYAFIEKWADEASLENHDNSYHFKTLGPQIQDLLETPAEVHVYSIIQ